MFLLGQNTQVPEAHRDPVKESNSNGWLEVHGSESPPGGTLVWVKHRDYFFRITSSDVGSKDPFALLKILYQMQAGDV